MKILEEYGVENKAHGISYVCERRIGYALFANASAVNHSCLPNATLRHCLPDSYDPLARQHDIFIEIVSIDQLTAGEEVFISYGPVAGKHSRNFRQKSLRSQYCFQCKCRACEGNEAGATQVNGTIALDPEGVDAIREVEALCGDVQTLREHASRVNEKASSLLMDNNVGVAVHYVHQTVEPLLKRARGLLNEHFSQPPTPEALDFTMYLEIYACVQGLADLIAHIYACNEDFSKAAVFLHEAILAMEKMNPSALSDPGIARERIKLAQLLFNSGDIQGAHGPLLQGMKDLAPHVDSKRDPDLLEARAILLFLQRRGL